MHTTFLVALFATTLSQNRTVVPSRYARVEADSATRLPFGAAGPVRVQYMYDKRLLAPQAMLIREIAIRGDGGIAKPAKRDVDIEIGIASTSTSPWAASSTFADNRGPWFRTAVRRKKVMLPAQPTSTPQPFVTRFVLDAPFVHLAARGHLLIEYIVHAQPPGDYAHDTSYGTPPRYRKVGTSCGGTGLIVIGGDSNASTPLVHYTIQGRPHGLAVLAFGDLAYPSPLKLPLGGCPLYQRVALSVATRLDGTGAGSYQFRLDRDWKDIGFYTQAISLDLPLTRIAASASHHLVIGGLDPQASVVAYSTTQPQGTVLLGLGIVTELVY